MLSRAVPAPTAARVGWERHPRRLQPGTGRGTRSPAAQRTRGCKPARGWLPARRPSLRGARSSPRYRPVAPAVLPQPAGTGPQAVLAAPGSPTGRGWPREGAGGGSSSRETRPDLRGTGGSSGSPPRQSPAVGGHPQGPWLCGGPPLAIFLLPYLPTTVGAQESFVEEEDGRTRRCGQGVSFPWVGLGQGTLGSSVEPRGRCVAVLSARWCVAVLSARCMPSG